MQDMRSSTPSFTLELELFSDLVEAVLAHGSEIAAAAHALAMLDVSSALAHIAAEQNYVRPVLENSLAFDMV